MIAINYTDFKSIMDIIGTKGAVKVNNPSVVVIGTHIATVARIDSVVGINVKAFHWLDTVAVHLLVAIVGLPEVK